MSLPVAILAGGLATRLRPLTETVPKILIPIAGRPFAEHQLELLKRHHVTRVVFCLGYLGERVAAELGDGSRWGMEFVYVYDGPTLLGTGGALRRALPELGQAFFVMYGDSYLQCDFAAIERSFHESGKAGLMTVFRNDDRWDRSNVEFRNGRILRYDKAAHDRAMEYIDYGLSVFRREAFLPWTADAPFDLAAVYRMLLDRNELAGFPVAERFYEIGSAEGLEETRALLEGEKRAQ